jgi:hypothetical protein
MHRRNFIKTTALSAIAVSATEKWQKVVVVYKREL